MITKRIKELYFFILKKKKFRKNNKHNFISIRTSTYSSLQVDKISVGKGSYGKIDVEFYGTEIEKIVIGNYCSFAPGTTLICGGNHDSSLFSTYPFFAIYGDHRFESLTNGPIIIEDDVWVGYNTLILSGVTIGKGAVIAAGSVVCKDIPPYAIVAGVPAKVIKYRFSKNIISKLVEIDLDKLSIPQLISIQNFGRLDDNNIQDFLKKFDDNK